MKKLLIFILGLALGVLGAAGIYLYTQGDVEWLTYLEDELIPTAVLALSSVSALCFALIPIVNKVNGTLIKFDTATSDVKATVASDKLMVDEVRGYREELTAMRSDINNAVDTVRATKGEIAQMIAPIEESAKNIEKIVHVGFEHNEELVKGGYAAAIAKVGGDNGKERKEE